jgi:hypothetical protein
MRPVAPWEPSEQAAVNVVQGWAISTSPLAQRPATQVESR